VSNPEADKQAELSQVDDSVTADQIEGNGVKYVGRVVNLHCTISNVLQGEEANATCLHTVTQGTPVNFVSVSSGHLVLVGDAVKELDSGQTLDFVGTVKEPIRGTNAFGGETQFSAVRVDYILETNGQSTVTSAPISAAPTPTGPIGTDAQGANQTVINGGAQAMPADVVRAYYQQWNQKDFAAMYELLSSKFQTLHPYSAYLHAHSFTDSIAVDATPSVASESDINVSIHSVDHDEHGNVSQSDFVGVWHVVRERGAWKLDKEDLHEIQASPGPH